MRRKKVKILSVAWIIQTERIRKIFLNQSFLTCQRVFSIKVMMEILFRNFSVKSQSRQISSLWKLKTLKKTILGKLCVKNIFVAIYSSCESWKACCWWMHRKMFSKAICKCRLSTCSVDNLRCSRNLWLDIISALFGNPKKVQYDLSLLSIQIYRWFWRMHQFQNWNVCFRSGFAFLCQ